MGSSLAQVSQSTQTQGKGFASPQPGQQNPVDAPAAQQQIQQAAGGVRLHPFKVSGAVN